MQRRPSALVSTVVGVATGVLAGVGILELLDAPVVIAAGEGIFAAMAAGTSVWAIPRLNALLGEETGSVGAAGVAGGVAGGVAALAVALPVFVTAIPFDVRLAMGILTFTFGLVGFGAATGLVVVRLSLADEAVRIDEATGTGTGFVEGIRTVSGERYVVAGALLGLVGAGIHLLDPAMLDPQLTGTLYGGVAMAGGGLLGYGAARIDRSSSGGSSATSGG